MPSAFVAISQQASPLRRGGLTAFALEPSQHEQAAGGVNSASFVSIDHVQLAMPRGREDDARAFYVGVLGMVEQPKPSDLAVRGGAWFESGDVQLHLGVERDFKPAGKAHPALRCAQYAALIARLRASGVTVSADTTFHDGAAHAYIDDPFGNRLELVEMPAEVLA